MLRSAALLAAGYKLFCLQHHIPFYGTHEQQLMVCKEHLRGLQLTEMQKERNS
jgi:hypothetical protein